MTAVAQQHHGLTSEGSRSAGSTTSTTSRMISDDRRVGWRRWTGRVLSTVAILFLTFDSVVKLSLSAEAAKGTEALGFPVSAVFPIGVLELVLLVLLLIPRTAVFGAVLWTGYLGGAVAIHVRVGNPLFTHILFPVYVAVLIWGGLWLRDRRVQALIAPIE